MENGSYKNSNISGDFDNLEADSRKNSVIRERVNLISSHMYKQFLEYNNATTNATEVFYKILGEMEQVTGFLKESFSSRGITSEQIFTQISNDKGVAFINILWNSITFTVRGNLRPQALYREGSPPLFTGRIVALNGHFENICDDFKKEDCSDILKNEIASLYIPANRNEEAIMKINHVGNKEFRINQIDAPREFLLKVVEIICGGGIYHEENFED